MFTLRPSGQVSRGATPSDVHLPARWLADKLLRGRVVFWSLLLWSAVTTATAFVTSVPQLLILRALLGVVESAYLSAAIALIGDYHGPKTRASAMGLHLAGLNFGVVAGGGLSCRIHTG